MTKTIRITAKCSDQFILTIKGKDYVGYSPRPFNGSSKMVNGDYVDLEIDNKTGRIVGWKPLTDKDLRQMTDNMTEIC